MMIKLHKCIHNSAKKLEQNEKILFIPKIQDPHDSQK